jgi:hypothetical protein
MPTLEQQQPPAAYARVDLRLVNMESGDTQDATSLSETTLGSRPVWMESSELIGVIPRCGDPVTASYWVERPSWSVEDEDRAELLRCRLHRAQENVAAAERALVNHYGYQYDDKRNWSKR